MSYLSNVAVSLDQLFNSIIGGDPDETFSSRVGKAQRGDYGRTVQNFATPLAWLLNILFIWNGWDHCLNCIEEDEGGQDLILGSGKVP